MICPGCGARNPEAASWCTQCFERLDNATAMEVVRASGEVEADGAGTASSARSGDVRVTGELVEWRCGRCDGWSALECVACVACGAPREGFATRTSSPTARVAAPTSRIASVFLPGLGHVLQGAVGSGVARMVLFVLWIGGGTALVGGAATAGAALILGAVVLWAATLIDVGRLPAGRRELLGARGLGALVAVVTVLLVLGAASQLVAG